MEFFNLESSVCEVNGYQLKKIFFSDALFISEIPVGMLKFT